jgi:hypothetical protein
MSFQLLAVSFQQKTDKKKFIFCVFKANKYSNINNRCFTCMTNPNLQVGDLSTSRYSALAKNDVKVNG